MEFDSLDVEKDFPGLYAAESADAKSKKSKEDSDYSETEHEKVSKKELLIGRRKDKKDKGKDRGYAALAGESSPEEDDTKSPTKFKKTKAFKFTSSKSKEKREKSRDKSENEERVKEKEKPEKEKEKKKDKERKDKDKKDKTKDKDKDKRDKKSKQNSTVSEEVLELGDVQPVFGVSISLATERSRCHDGIDLPLVVRDCIDYLQEHALQNEQIYKMEPLKTRLQHYKRLYNNRERQPETDELDVATSCGLLKLFLRKLPEPILTTDLMSRFEEVASHAQVTKQQEELQQLLEQLPSCNKTLLIWIILHFDAVIQNEKTNKLNAQSLAMLLSPPMQMSHRLLVTLLCHCPNLFSHIKLIKYVPPITASSPKLPDNIEDIELELRKQESLLAQIHAEMNAGFVSKKREEQLWEVQRIITQLKRKLRQVRNQQGKSVDETATIEQEQPQQLAKQIEQQPQEQQSQQEQIQDLEKRQRSCSDEEELNTQNVIETTTVTTTTTGKDSTIFVNELDSSGHLILPKTHADYEALMRLQFENEELKVWKTELQSRITNERAEILRLKQAYQQQEARIKYQLGVNSIKINEQINELHNLEVADDEYERVIEHFERENMLLEHKRSMLAKQIFDERRECLALQVQLQMHQIH